MVTVPPQLSPVEMALPVLLGSVESPQASTLSAGQLMFGPVLSAKLLCCTQLLVLWQAFAAHQVRFMPARALAMGSSGASTLVANTPPLPLAPPPASTAALCWMR